jgi:hypothetical protein
MARCMPVCRGTGGRGTIPAVVHGRVKFPPPDVDVSQVECLVDLAVDPNMLGRQWMGLATWA